MTKKKLLSLALALALTLSLAACGGGKADQSPAETPEDTQAPEDASTKEDPRRRKTARPKKTPGSPSPRTPVTRRNRKRNPTPCPPGLRPTPLKTAC
jgi:predicted small lipoprotein YifL